MLGIPTQLIHTICVPLQLNIFDLALQSQGHDIMKQFTTIYVSEFGDTEHDIGVTKEPKNSENSKDFKLLNSEARIEATTSRIGQKAALFSPSNQNLFGR